MIRPFMKCRLLTGIMVVFSNILARAQFSLHRHFLSSYKIMMENVGTCKLFCGDDNMMAWPQFWDEHMIPGRHDGPQCTSLLQASSFAREGTLW